MQERQLLARCVTFHHPFPTSPLLSSPRFLPPLPFPSPEAAIYHRRSRDTFAKDNSTNTTPPTSHPPIGFSGIYKFIRFFFAFADDVDPRPASTLAFHPLFYYLHFTAGAELDPAAVLHTTLPTHPDCRRKVYAPLCGHASASCAFVTSPPVRSITLLRPDSESTIASVRNPDGCTVLDVNRLLGDLCVYCFALCTFVLCGLVS